MRARDQEGQGVDEADAGLLRLRQGGDGVMLHEPVEGAPGERPEDARVRGGPVPALAHGPVGDGGLEDDAALHRQLRRGGGRLRGADGRGRGGRGRRGHLAAGAGGGDGRAVCI